MEGHTIEKAQWHLIEVRAGVTKCFLHQRAWRRHVDWSDKEDGAEQRRKTL